MYNNSCWHIQWIVDWMLHNEPDVTLQETTSSSVQTVPDEIVSVIDAQTTGNYTSLFFLLNNMSIMLADASESESESESKSESESESESESASESESEVSRSSSDSEEEVIRKKPSEFKQFQAIIDVSSKRQKGSRKPDDVSVQQTVIVTRSLKTTDNSGT
jgi:hypothetical protein